ncbi:hypothetical protein HMPREF1352_00162 [Enterococcus faecium 511]|uniref:Uncharacterized protein n=2 Tax=Enterococcus faecium TaxID=1352 RepID=J7CWZ2_ENTFC|nr:predicted protein [Enterococcus faecium 1,230,933]EFR68704.1 hypothetical protein HMPREF9524_01135 [Enterococcus faecium TX0133a01]EFR74217.1 hypothetical protein HMPREF9523_01857 [Enterococcus faecium TX0133A]EFR77133.1 hypothetical protein HMPREF9527_02063 [Enterococcus faecium TX0133C]EFS06029.1 hypothetical protein HMPREF9525_01884 [Enterococcus faecium TX0133a04]EJX36929.1 hypothetical protein HMPREF1381_03302 [Enterococcus faecium R501]EJX39256.1 hypothetical protein HMPREF1382_02595
MLFCLLILENKKTELTFEVSLTVLKVLKQTKEQGNQSISIQTRDCDKRLVTAPYSE